ncbi:MAG: hypothetical protein ACREQI_00545, partial [Candidatus Binataceae bacterium]
RRVIARASRHIRCSRFSIARPYHPHRTSLNVYAPDISNVYDNRQPRPHCQALVIALQPWR